MVVSDALIWVILTNRLLRPNITDQMKMYLRQPIQIGYFDQSAFLQCVENHRFFVDSIRAVCHLELICAHTHTTRLSDELGLSNF